MKPSKPFKVKMIKKNRGKKKKQDFDYLALVFDFIAVQDYTIMPAIQECMNLDNCKIIFVVSLKRKKKMMHIYNLHTQPHTHK